MGITIGHGGFVLRQRSGVEAVTGAADATNEKRYQAVHRVRSRIEEFEQDAEMLEEHHPELYRELREAGCDDD